MCDLDVTGVPSIFKVIHSTVDLVRMLPTFDLNYKDTLGGVQTVVVCYESIK